MTKKTDQLLDGLADQIEDVSGYAMVKSLRIEIEKLEQDNQRMAKMLGEIDCAICNKRLIEHQELCEG